MPRTDTGLSVTGDPLFQEKMLDMLRQIGRLGMGI